MRIYDVIADKRDGKPLSAEQIEFFVKGYSNGTIPDYQAAALLMAIFIRGMNEQETFLLAKSMTESGDVADLSRISGVKADKHSTGGVGDKTSLIVVPLAAVCGLKMVKMSGRGLGHTGGTVDKLNSIPGFNTELNEKNFYDIINNVGAAIVGKVGNLAPADKKLYALRDVTATVSSIPLIAASIMSKKLAAGADCIVLDVKTGSGAFMKKIDDSVNLADIMVSIGKKAGKKVAALITDMSRPLGKAVGNSLEVQEAIQILKGEDLSSDLTRLCVSLTACLLELADICSMEEGEKLAIQKLRDNSAYEKLCEIVRLQGGNEDYIRDPKKFEKAKYLYDVTADASGYIYSVDAEKAGIAAMLAGAGRDKKEDDIDYSAGIIFVKTLNDYVRVGDTLAVVHSNKTAVSDCLNTLKSAFVIKDHQPILAPLIYSIIK